MSNMNDQIQKEAAAAVAWFRHPVPLWTIGLAFLVGALAGCL